MIKIAKNTDIEEICKLRILQQKEMIGKKNMLINLIYIILQKSLR